MRGRGGVRGGSSVGRRGGVGGRSRGRGRRGGSYFAILVAVRASTARGVEATTVVDPWANSLEEI